VHLRRKLFSVAAYLIHFFLIGAISSRELFWVLSRSRTVFPPAWNRFWREAQNAGSIALLQTPATPRWLQQSTTAYFHLAGIEAGYGFFAPNVSSACKLVFELHYPDGHTESTVPAVSSDAAGLRVGTLLDKFGRPQYDPMRASVIGMLTSAVWREHRDAIMIRAVFGVVTLPSVEQFEQGAGPSNEFLYAYDFAFDEQGAVERKP
jgi:hypothetical protein